MRGERVRHRILIECLQNVHQLLAARLSLSLQCVFNCTIIVYLTVSVSISSHQRAA